MNTEIIKQYIDFAVNNDFKALDNDFRIKNNIHNKERDYNDEVNIDETMHWVFIFHWCCDIWCDIISLEKVIMSKDFIIAISKGFKKKPWFRKLQYWTLEEYFCEAQTLAIMNGKLEEFIKTII